MRSFVQPTSEGTNRYTEQFRRSRFLERPFRYGSHDESMQAMRAFCRKWHRLGIGRGKISVVLQHLPVA